MDDPVSRRTSSLPSPSGLEPVEVDPGRFRYSMWENVSIGVWEGQATREAAMRILALARHNTARFPGGHSSLIFVAKGAPAPTPEASAIFAELYRPTGRTGLGCLGVVLEGEGFWASAMRSMVTGMRLRAGSDMALRVSEALEDLLPWFVEEHARRTGSSLMPGAFRRILGAARDQGTTE